MKDVQRGRSPLHKRGRSPLSGSRKRVASPFVAGFTLIEVLAALVIVALGMLGAIQAVNQSARNGTYLREKTLAHWIAMNLITEQRLQGSPPNTTESNGEVEFADTRWRWTLKVTQTEVKSLRRMDVSVRLASAPDGTSLAALSGFYGSAMAAAGGTQLSWVGTGAPGTGDQDDQETDEGDTEGRRDLPKRPRRPPDEEVE
jgi:type II secretion system protein I